MEDMLQETESPLQVGSPPELAEALGELLREHKGIDVLVLDLRQMSAWTDFFVIATATSETHLDGMERHIREFCREHDIEILRRSRKPGKSGGVQAQEDEWRIIDLGTVVIHLMSRRSRSFYNLERLYSMASAEPPALTGGP